MKLWQAMTLSVWACGCFESLDTSKMGCLLGTANACPTGLTCVPVDGGGVCTRDAGAGFLEDAGPAVDMGQPDQPLPTDTAPADVALDAADTAAIDGTSVDGQAVDGAATDVLSGEAGAVDTSVPDAPGTCMADRDCPSSLLPYCVSYRCVACRTSNECSNLAGTPFCSAANTCVSCAAAPAAAGVCSGATPVCDSASGRCVECTRNSECSTPGKAFCVANQCVGCHVPGASASDPTGATDGGASDGGGAIDAGVLAPCSGAKPVCATSGTLIGQCVECASSADCSGSTPICSTNLCTPCTTDKQCADKGGGPGVCMSHQDNRCASEAETIYVKSSASCSGGGGTAASPFCDTQAAVNAVTSSKRVIVLKGPATDVLSPISATPSGAQVSMVGQNGATLGGSVIGIRVTTGDVYIRGLTVANGTRVGIQVEAGATLRLDRCILKNNAGGGLLVKTGANFDIANCVFDNNGPGVDGVARFGGAYLAGAPASSGPSTFRFNTVVNNQETGVVCADSTQNLFGMLMLDNVSGAFLNCDLKVKTEGERTLGADSKWDSPGTGSDISDPRFSTANPYHLTASSPCRDFIAPSGLILPIDDMDGDVRPYPSTGKFDCGADEYRP